MSDHPLASFTSIEFTVADLGPCIELFSTLLGLEMAGPVRHPSVDAEVVQFRSGGTVINLLCPTDTGLGLPMQSPEPRLSQLTFSVADPETLVALRASLAGAGASVTARQEDLFFLDPKMTEGLIGCEAAVVFSALEPASEDSTSGGAEGQQR